jgi:uncharacterized cupin superfamily protein
VEILAMRYVLIPDWSRVMGWRGRNLQAAFFEHPKCCFFSLLPPCLERV